MSINSYGDKVDTVKIGRYDDGNFKYVHLPRIEVNGKMCCIHDENTKSKCVEFDDKKEAIQTAKDALQELKNNNMI